MEDRGGAATSSRVHSAPYETSLGRVFHYTKGIGTFKKISNCRIKLKITHSLTINCQQNNGKMA